MENYTPKQIFIIRNAIEQGRRAMAELGNNAAVFAEAFIKADGIQIPSKELEESTRQRINEYVLKSLAGEPVFELWFAWPKYSILCNFQIIQQLCI